MREIHEFRDFVIIHKMRICDYNVFHVEQRRDDISPNSRRCQLWQATDSLNSLRGIHHHLRMNNSNSLMVHLSHNAVFATFRCASCRLMNVVCGVPLTHTHTCSTATVKRR